MNVKRLHFIHRWTGLLSGVNILILSITGVYLVFSDEIHHAFEAPRGEAIAAVDPAGVSPLQSAVDTLLAQKPGMEAHSVRTMEDVPGTMGIVLRQGREHFEAYEYDVASGEIFTHEETAADRVNDFILHLHADLFMGTMGILFLGVVGTLFLVSTITGILIYAPFMKRSVYGALRWDRGVRRSSAGLHKLIGSTSLGFNLVMALTGIALTFGLALARIWLFNEATALIRADTAGTAGGAPITVDAAWASAAALHPDIPISSINFPGGLQGPGHYLAWHADPEALSRYIPVLSLVPRSTATGAMTVEVPLWIQGTLICVPFHFGNFGGLGIKLVYAFFGLSAGALSVSGAVLSFSAWRKRRRMRQVQGGELALPLTVSNERGVVQ